MTLGIGNKFKISKLKKLYPLNLLLLFFDFSATVHLYFYHSIHLTPPITEYSVNLILNPYVPGTGLDKGDKKKSRHPLNFPENHNN